MRGESSEVNKSGYRPTRAGTLAVNWEHLQTTGLQRG